MTRTQLKKKLQFDQEIGEGQFVEFKEVLDKTLSKEIVAFANASGGFVYIGVTDLSEVKGIEINNKVLSQIQDTAYNCDPSVIVILHKIENVIAVEVKEGKNKPYSCSSGFYMRMGANSQKMKRDEILSLAVKLGRIRFDEQICVNFDWADFDDEKFDYYLKITNISNNLSREEILKNLRVLNNEGLTNAGVLYFAKNPYKYILSSKIRCIHFNDDQRIDILDKKVVDRGIIGNIEFAVAYLKERVPVRYKITKLKRDEFPEYPEEAYREAIVNAIIHFDYFLGDTIAIEKLKSSIVINNKGELLFPQEDFGKRSEARNRLMADLLTRTQLMEKAGTGIKRVSDACKANNNKCTFEFTDAFWVKIYSNISDEDGIKDGISIGIKDGINELNETQNAIIKLIIKEPSITAERLSKIVGINKRNIENNLAVLKKEGIIERKGSRKKGHWEVIKREDK